MIRWKRSSKNNWYYLPQVFNNPNEAHARCERTRKGDQRFYRIEVVEIGIVRVLEGNDEFQGPPVQQ